MRDMSQSGVSVGMMSHKHERYESEWSKCGEKKRARVNRNTDLRSTVAGTTTGDEAAAVAKV